VLSVSGLVGAHTRARTPAVAAQAETAATDAAWLNNVAQAVLDTSLPPRFVSLTAAQLARGLAPRTAMLRLLRTPAARRALSQQDFQLLLGRPATTAELNGPQSAALLAGSQEVVLAQIAASQEYFDQAGGNAAGYRAAVARDLLGGLALPAGLARLPVQTRLERAQVIGRLLQTPGFLQASADRLAGMALEEGSFSASQMRAAARALSQRDGFRLILARFLGTPLSQSDVARRAAPVPAPAPADSAVLAGPALPQYFGVNPQGLVPDSVTDPIAYGDPSTSPSGGVPMDSPWGKSVVFPEVPYQTIMAGGAAQPVLQLPNSLIKPWTTALGSGGLTFQTWFQAKSPGALLSETLTVNGATTQVPLVYINSLGNLVSGLFDGTSLAPNAGETILNWNPPDSAKGPFGGDPGQGPYQIGAASPLISQMSVVDNTWHHLAFVVSNKSEALYLDGVLQGEIQPSGDSSYSFNPTLSSGNSVSGPSAFTMGGPIVPEPNIAPLPQINYPQGFVGTIDEVAAWTRKLTQTEVQEAMTAPISRDRLLRPGLVAYFNFNQPPSNGAWRNDAPGARGVAQGPTSGTMLVPVATTIPTDPFPTSKTDQRLPGARDWGIDLMMPLSASSVNVTGGKTVSYKVALAAGDMLEISIPDADSGTLTVQVESDLGTKTSESLTGGDVKYLAAARTGTYKLTLTWAPGPSSNATVNFSQIPGPLNNLMEMLTSYTQQGPNNVVYTWAYGDPKLPGINNKAGYQPGDTAAASYWPLWSHKTFFPVPKGKSPATWARALSDAYAKLVANSSLKNSGFANIINVLFADNQIVSDIQADLDNGYTAAYGVSPPTPPTVGGAFPVVPTSRAQDEVYEFLYNADLMRQTMYSVANGSGAGTLQSWVARLKSDINNSTVPGDIANEIAEGQDEMVENVSVQVPSQFNSAGQLIGHAAAWGVGGALAALASLEAIVDFFSAGALTPLLGALFAGAASSLVSDFIGEMGVPGYTNLTVPVTQLTTNMLDASKLGDLAGNVKSDVYDQWNNILTALESTTFIETYLSNYGLLEAFQDMSGSQLDTSSQSTSGGQPPISPQTAVTATLSRLSWSSMIPAVFQWSPTISYNFPTANGQTTDLSNQSISLDGPQGQNGPDGASGVVAGNFFTNDSNLDLAVTNYSSNNVSILKGNGSGTFTTVWPPATLDGQEGPEGIAVGNFVNGSSNEDLAVADYYSDNVTILIGRGDGTFTPHAVGLGGPNGPESIAVGNFVNGSSTQDLAVADYSSNAVSILIGDGQGNFTAHTITGGSLDGPAGIAVGDFYNNGDEDLAVTDNSSDAVTILKGDGDGNFHQSNTIDLGLFQLTQPQGIIAGDFNGDGNLDLAVASVDNNNGQSDVSILLGDGNGHFTVTNIALNVRGFDIGPEEITTIKLNGGIFPDLAVTYIYGEDQSGVALLINRGNGSFFAPVFYNLGNAEGALGIVAGDFSGNGLSQLVVANYGTSNLSFVSGTTVGNFATFLPASSGTLPQLGAMQDLQGGNPIHVGPINDTGTIQPSTSNPPDYLGYISLPYYPDGAPLNFYSPDYFLSVTPAQMQQSASGYSYKQAGSIITGWDLVDPNGNPIATSTLQALFGVPVADTSDTPAGYTGTDLTPVNPSQPFAGLNGAWYFAANPAPSSYATWADAFFNWGQGIAGYSPRNLIPYFDQGAEQSGMLPGSSTTFPSDFSYTLTYSAETSAPPYAGIAVNLAGVFNRQGIVSDGTKFSSVGLAGGFAFSAQSLQRVVIFNGVLLNLNLPLYIYNAAHKVVGATDPQNAISASGQTIDLPSGTFGTLTFLGSAVSGNQPDQKFTISYTDGTKQTLTRSISDWATPQHYDGETIVATTPYRDLANGTVQPGNFNVYGYSFKLESGKTVRSITLPKNPNVTILAMTLS